MIAVFAPDFKYLSLFAMESHIVDQLAAFLMDLRVLFEHFEERFSFEIVVLRESSTDDLVEHLSAEEELALSKILPLPEILLVISDGVEGCYFASHEEAQQERRGCV